jgi:hypothetical protein
VLPDPGGRTVLQAGRDSRAGAWLTTWGTGGSRTRIGFSVEGTGRSHGDSRGRRGPSHWAIRMHSCAGLSRPRPPDVFTQQLRTPSAWTYVRASGAASLSSPEETPTSSSLRFECNAAKRANNSARSSTVPSTRELTHRVAANIPSPVASIDR